MDLKDYIVEKTNKTRHLFKNYKIYNKILFVVKSSTNINVNELVQLIHEVIPEHFFNESIKVIKLKKLEDNVSAIKLDDEIIISSDIEDEYEILKALLHELGHFLFEELDSVEIELLRSEYRDKKLKVLRQVKKPSSIPEDAFIDYVENEIGLHNFQVVTDPYFASPYASYSLKEYFCNGLEIFFVEDKNWLYSHCFYLYKAINNLSIGDKND